MIENFDPTTTMMVGDRISTDIKFGVASKCRYSCLVLGGSTSREEMEKQMGKLVTEGQENVEVAYGQGVYEILENLQGR